MYIVGLGGGFDEADKDAGGDGMLKEFKESFGADLFCPVCDTALKVDDPFEYFEHDGDTYEFDCPKCKKTLELRISFCQSYEAKVMGMPEVVK